jgi:hypothetical protein
MVEEAALGNAGRRDQLLDRGGGKSFGEHCVFRERKQTLPGVAGLAGGLSSMAHCTTSTVGRAAPRRNAAPRDYLVKK